MEKDVSQNLWKRPSMVISYYVLLITEMMKSISYWIIIITQCYFCESWRYVELLKNCQ